MTIKSVVCEPSNCLLFVIDAAGGIVPEYVPYEAAVSTEIAITVSCQAFEEGPTRVTIGGDAEVDPGRAPAHERVLLTPRRLVRVEMVSEEVVVDHPVADEMTRVRIWTNRDFLSDEIIVGLS